MATSRAPGDGVEKTKGRVDRPAGEPARRPDVDRKDERKDEKKDEKKGSPADTKGEGGAADPGTVERAKRSTDEAKRAADEAIDVEKGKLRE